MLRGAFARGEQAGLNRAFRDLENFRDLALRKAHSIAEEKDHRLFLREEIKGQLGSRLARAGALPNRDLLRQREGREAEEQVARIALVVLGSETLARLAIHLIQELAGDIFLATK